MKTIKVAYGEPYQGPTGIWRGVIIRDGEARWFSLGTRDERKARAKIRKMRQQLEGIISEYRPV